MQQAKQKHDVDPAHPYMTIEEIARLYPSEWVVIDDIQLAEEVHVLGGCVRFHSPDRDEADARALELDLSSPCTIRYMGEPAPGLDFIL